MLDISNVSKTFNKGTINEKHALCGLQLHLNPGDFCTVIGGNGAGKSTMLNAVAGVWPVDEGRIVLDGHDITALPEYKRAHLIGNLTQTGKINHTRICRSTSHDQLRLHFQRLLLQRIVIDHFSVIRHAVSNEI